MSSDVIEGPAKIVDMALVEETLAYIREHRENWDQGEWGADWSPEEYNVCNTTHCFGGWALHLRNRIQVIKRSGYYSLEPLNEDGTLAFSWGRAAREVLGFNKHLGNQIFYSGIYPNFDEFEAYVREQINLYGDLTKTEADFYDSSDS